jgi:hypothetical protein
METELREAMVAGLFVEFCDPRGNCVAQSVYLDWHSRPLPAAGDSLTCSVTNATTGRVAQISGRVRTRHFDVQKDGEGHVSVWVRITVDATNRSSRRTSMGNYRPVSFSDN